MPANWKFSPCPQPVVHTAHCGRVCPWVVVRKCSYPQRDARRWSRVFSRRPWTGPKVGPLPLRADWKSRYLQWYTLRSSLKSPALACGLEVGSAVTLSGTQCAQARFFVGRCVALSACFSSDPNGTVRSSARGRSFVGRCVVFSACFGSDRNGMLSRGE